MSRDDEKPGYTTERARRFDASTPSSGSRREPSFSNLEDLHEDGYEEPDRDTNFTSGYRADSVEEEEIYDDAYPEDDERDVFADSESDRPLDPEEAAEEDSDGWLEEGDEQEERQRWPMGLIAIAVLAVVLLGAGGYGVLQQRAAAEAEIRELRAALAVAATPGDAGEHRGALETLQQSYDKLSAQAEALTLENRRLADTVAGLEAQLGTQQSVPAKPVPVQKSPSTASEDSVTPNTDKPAASQVASSQTTVPQSTAPQPAAQQPAKSVTAAPMPVAEPPAAAERAPSNSQGPWFVNFGTYATRNMADTWASRVRPSAGEVIVVPNEKDGRTLYRVRVVGLSDRESAQQVARKLESDLRVPALWVGRE